MWLLQAAVIAWAITGWAAGEPALFRSLVAGSVFLACAIVRAGLEHHSAALLYALADQTIARERAALINREAREKAQIGSAGLASVLVQKLPLLQPWITRYHVAMFRVSVLPVLLLVLAFSQSWVVGLTLLLAGPLIPVFMALVGMAAEDASRKQMAEITSLNDMAMERLSALLDIRVLGASKRAESDFSVRATALRERTMAVLRVAFLSSTVLELFAAIGVAMVAVFVGFTLLGELSFGTWGAELGLGQGIFLLLIAPEFFQPMRDLAAAWHDRASGLAVVAELDALDAAERVPVVGAAEREEPMRGSLEVRLARAKANLGGHHVLLPDLTVAAQETVALTGPSGSGKSTTLSVITGLVPLVAGQVEVCGHVLNDATADSWRARVAFVPQKPHFPDMALKEWLDSRQTGDDPWAALELAGVADVVRSLPEGIFTHLGESGGGVSGGEARRLMLARAICSGADLILADEPTADLDPDTAARIIETFGRLRQDGCSLIVATHDPELIAALDRQVEIRP